jgi:hypothetical protein
VVPNAAVTLTSETRGTVFTAKSGSTGDYIFSSIPGDSYKVDVELNGFEKVERTGILAITADTVAVPPIALEVGSRRPAASVPWSWKRKLFRTFR